MWLIEVYGKMFPDIPGIPGFGLCLVVTGCSFSGIEVTVAWSWQPFSTCWG